MARNLEPSWVAANILGSFWKEHNKHFDFRRRNPFFLVTSRPANKNRQTKQTDDHIQNFLATGPSSALAPILISRLRLNCDGTREETIFRLSAKRTSLFKSAGASVQSTTGSRGVRITGSNTGYTMFRGSVKSTGYPLHSPVSPSLPLPCVTVCHHISTLLYLSLFWTLPRSTPIPLSALLYVHISPVHPNPSTCTCLSLHCTLLGPPQFMYLFVIAVQILFNEPDAWGSWMLWNVGLLVPDDKASHPRRQ